MPTPILATKLYIPPPRPNVVVRTRLLVQLNEGLHRKLTLISASAGFGKTTLVSEWIAGCGRPAAWLSLDEGDNDPNRFLTYLIAALQTVAPGVGQGFLAVLQAPQPPPAEVVLTSLLNEMTTLPDSFVLVIDDYHIIDSKPVDAILDFLIEHQPRQMHLVIATREDPHLPLARLRVQNQLTELRATDLRFTLSEAAGFLNQMMGLRLSSDDVAALEARTEGWIAGLQLAGIALQGPVSMQGHKDTSSFIKTFTGSHHFVLDYLVEEVLQQQPESVQTFLLGTSVLNRLCGPLCDAVLLSPSALGQETLANLERANLFIVPLDNERRWYRYHHLFGDLLRQRHHQSLASTAGDAESRMNELHIRASQWYEDNGLDIEAFHHAAAANDIERAERLIEGKGIPLHFRGAVMAIVDWLGSLAPAVMNARPTLWWRHAALLLVNGQTTGVQEKLQAAEDAIQGSEDDEQTRHFIGRIAVARATLALTRYQVDEMLAQSRRALEYLHPQYLSNRANAYWTMAVAHQWMGNRIASRQAFAESIALSQAAGDVFVSILATIGLGNVQQADNELHLAAQTYRQVLQWAGDQPLQIIYDAHLGLARILYEWNDLESAEQHGQQGLHLALQYDKVIDRFIVCEIFLAQLKLAQGDLAGADQLLAQAHQSARQKNFIYRIPEVAAAQVPVLIQQGNLTAAADLAQAHNLPASLARVHLAQGNPSAALALLEPLRQQFDAKNWPDERLRVMVLQALALWAHDEKDTAVQVLAEVLKLSEPEGFIRTFVDEGHPMAELLSAAAARGLMPGYINKLLAAFETETKLSPVTTAPLVEPLTQRELEVLQLIAQGLSNNAISERLFLALSTVKGHIQSIFGKLQVQRRTEAVARARELGLL
jgi:LuxR family transcriptional regulator, maltose regulon positive regulatory protein